MTPARPLVVLTGAMLALAAACSHPPPACQFDLAANVAVARLFQGIDTTFREQAEQRFLTHGFISDEGGVLATDCSNRILLPSVSEGCTTLRLELSAAGADQCTAAVFMNGVPLGESIITAAPIERRYDLPKAARRTGVATLELRLPGVSSESSRSKGGVRLHRLILSGDSGEVVPIEAAGGEVRVPAGSRLQYCAAYSPGARLLLQWRTRGAARARLTARSDGTAPVRIEMTHTWFKPWGWQHLELPIHETVQIEIEATGDSGDLMLRGGIFHAPGVPAPTAVPEPRPAADNLAILLLDAARADHLGAWGHASGHAPMLDRLARTSVQFTNCSTTAPYTVAAVASLMTGLYPETHGVIDFGYRLDGGLPTLAGILAMHGTTTVAVTANPAASGINHVLNGFEDMFECFKMSTSTIPAAAIADQALAWLERRPPEPFFMYLHFLEPHAPYLPPDGYRERFGRIEDAARLGDVDYLGGVEAAGEHMPEARRRDVMQLYDANLSYVDAQVARVLRVLEARRDTAVIVLADHGEAFQEHGRLLHNSTLFQEMTHVPLLIHAPHVRPRLDTRPCSLVDVLPTALGLLGSTTAPSGVGIDLLATGASRAEPLYMRGGMPGQPMRAVFDGDFKMILDERSQTRSLYDLNSDPAERQDLGTLLPVRTGLMEQWLRRQLMMQAQRRRELLTHDEPEFTLNGEQIDQLQRLGYLR